MTHPEASSSLEKIDPSLIEEAVQRLAAGAVIGLPTETVYGLAANACHDGAVAQIFSLKGRPTTHPLIVHIAHANQLDHFVDAAHIPAFAHALMDAFWPGPLTLVFERRPGVAEQAAGGLPTLAVRCPAHPLAQAVLQRAHAQGIQGLAAPSANRFGKLSPTCAAHVQGEWAQAVWVLDGGPCHVGIESSIVDCTVTPPRLLRPGMLSAQDLSQACGLTVQTACAHAATTAVSTGDVPIVPGSLTSHYAPAARVRWMNEAQLLAAWEEAMASQSSSSSVSDSASTPSTHSPVQASLFPELAAEVIQKPPTGRRKAKASIKLSPSIGIYGRVQALLTPAAGFVEGRSHPDLLPSSWVYRAMPRTPAAMAQELFAVLRSFDTLGVAEIWVQNLPKGQQWAGIQDRLNRAAADPEPACSDIPDKLGPTHG
jgi:L-threonylcarbamoyladenylate synthase